jgi:hypothetical protein
MRRVIVSALLRCHWGRYLEKPETAEDYGIVLDEIETRMIEERQSPPLHSGIGQLKERGIR